MIFVISAKARIQFLISVMDPWIKPEDEGGEATDAF